MLKTGITIDPRYTQHLTGTGHPERPERYNAVIQGIQKTVSQAKIKYISPSPAGEEDILLCHTQDYLQSVKNDIAEGYPCLRTGDTNISDKSFEVSLLAAGAVITAINAVMNGETRNAFCPVRPPGHHASSNRGMGFCIFNNAAIGARYAQQKHNIERVLIVDWDVHHGNGTQDIFYEDPSVFYFSTHQWPCYPGTGMAHETGAKKGKGFTMNCPCIPGSGKTEIIQQSMLDKLVPAMKSYKPELVIISAGFDSRIGDTIGALALYDDDFAQMTRICMAIAAEFADSRLVSVLEGGYALPGLTSAAGIHISTLAGNNLEYSQKNK